MCLQKKKSSMFLIQRQQSVLSTNCHQTHSMPPAAWGRTGSRGLGPREGMGSQTLPTTPGSAAHPVANRNQATQQWDAN